MTSEIESYIEDRDAFYQLSLEEQLNIVADLILYYAKQKTDALRAAGKTRIDSCVEAMEANDMEKYYGNVQTNVRRLLETETVRERMGH